MAELKDKILFEIENIDHLFRELPTAERLSHFSILELAGVATLLHNFYSGIENILKQILLEKKIKLPEGSSWHKDLLLMSMNEGIISNSLKQELADYLAFRHFFIHAYALDLYPKRMEPLLVNIDQIYNSFLYEISAFYK